MSYDRVTSVIGATYMDEGLLDWFKRTSKAKIEKTNSTALTVGSAVHEAIEADILQKEYEMEVSNSDLDYGQFENCMMAWQQFRKEKGPLINETEVRLFDESMRVSGSYDMRIWDDAILDIKTSSKMNKSYWIQTAVYAHMCKHPIKWLYVLRLDKKGGFYELYKKPYDSKYMDVFLSMLDVYRYYEYTKMVF